MRILVTGAAGFIGAALSQRLLDDGHTVLGLDSLNDYYDPALKQARLARLTPHSEFRFVLADLADAGAKSRQAVFNAPERVAHLAAQAGVRYSLHNPRAYVDANIVGFLNVLEAARHQGCAHLVYASSSSVYGASPSLPFSVDQPVDHPISLYAATKKANELMAHTYSHLYALPTTGLRFFTVYGPWGRPDMAPYLFTSKILAGEPIQVFNHGRHSRDFTYIDDIVEGVVRVLHHAPTGDPGFDPRHPTPASSAAPYRVYNIGNHRPVQLLRFIEVIEQAAGRKAVLQMAPMQPGDVPDTEADVSALMRDVGYAPGTPIEQGVENLVRWYRDYHQ
jgi:UDP-glucuronate 4-epimerase